MRSEKTKNRAKGMRVKSSIKAGECGQNGNNLMGNCHNHNQTVSKAKGLRVRSSIKAGLLECENNHNQTVASGLRVKSGIKAGPQVILGPQR